MVPTLDFKNGTRAPVLSNDDPNAGQYHGPSAYWNESLFISMVTPPGLSYKRPGGCAGACVYTVDYTAPGLNCTATPAQGVDDTTVFRSNSSLYRNTMGSNGTNENNFDTTGPYNMSLDYFPVNYTESQSGGLSIYTQSRPGPSGGVFCEFRDTNYRATFNFTEDSRSISTKILSYGKVLGGADQNCSTINSEPGVASACWLEGVNNRATCETFAMFFYGSVRWDNSTAFTPAIGKETVFRRIFDLVLLPKNPTYFGLHAKNPDQTLVDMFSDLMLGIMTLRGDTAEVKATVWDGRMVWKYHAHILWVVYGTAIGIILAVCLFSVYCTVSNGLEVDNRFSHFLVATRNSQLDQLCQDAKTIDELREHELHWRDGVFMEEHASSVMDEHETNEKEKEPRQQV